MDEEKARQIAVRICEEFEELLDEKNIVIASADRTGRPEEACLYGEAFWRMEDAIVDMMMAQPDTRFSNEESWSASHPARQLATRICDEFEELLAEHDIKVDSNDRTGDSEEGCLFGSEYYALEDAIVGILVGEFGAGTTSEEAAPLSTEARRGTASVR